MILGNISQVAQRVLSVLPAGVRRRLPPHLYLPFSRPYWLVKGGARVRAPGAISWGFQWYPCGKAMCCREIVKDCIIPFMLSIRMLLAADD